MKKQMKDETIESVLNEVEEFVEVEEFSKSESEGEGKEEVFLFIKFFY